MRPRGFSIIELLVTIGIMAVVLSILLPVMSSARRSSRAVYCAANLQQIGVALASAAASHDGYMPLAGRIMVHGNPAGNVSMAPLLGDNEKRRYAYMSGSPGLGFLEIVAPLMNALVPELGVGNASFPTASEVYNASQNEPIGWRVFKCPGEPARIAGANFLEIVPMVDGIPIIMMGPQAADYAANEAVFGFRAGQRAYLAGRAAAIRRPSVTLLLADGGAPTRFRGGGDGAPLFWEIQPGAPRPLNLGDALDGGGRVFSRSPLFDPLRHRGRMNILFADGHVAVRSIDANSLRDVIVADW